MMRTKIHKVLLVMIAVMCIATLGGCVSITEKTSSSVSSTSKRARHTGNETAEYFGTEPTVRFDGLYCYINDSDHDGWTNNYVLRFYDNGDVISASIEENETSGYFPKSYWFDRETDRYASLVGFYDFSNGKINITTVSETGTVDYWGSVNKGNMVLSGHSNINGNNFQNRSYVFYPFEDIAVWNQGKNS